MTTLELVERLEYEVLTNSMSAAPDRLTLALQWVRDTAETAVSGSGGHDVTYKTACFLVHGFEMSDADIYAAMDVYNQSKCTPPWNEGQLKHKLDNARRTPSKYPPGWLYRKMLRDQGYMLPRAHGGGGASNGSGTSAPALPVSAPVFDPKWKLPFQYELLKRSVASGCQVDADWFRSMSPVDVRTVSPVQYLDAVYDPGDKVLIFTRFASQGQFIHWVGKGSFRVADRPDVKGKPSPLPTGAPDGVWYLAQPIDGLWKPNPEQGGKLSRRSQLNIVSQRFFMLECDHKEKACPCKDCAGRDNPGIVELWMKFIAKLPLPVVAVYTSGGKSVHALCKMDFPSKAHLDRFKANHGGMFSRLGADARGWSPTQLTRLPGCLRGGRKQELLYLNPSPDPGGIPITEGGNACVTE